MRQGGQPSRGRPAAGGPYHDRPGRRGLPPAATDTAARGARRGARNRNWPRSSTMSSPRRAGSRAKARRRALRGLSRLTRRPAMSVIPTLSSRRTGPGDGSHLLVRVPHTIVHDASRGTHNRSIGTADADLSAAASSRPVRQVTHAAERLPRCVIIAGCGYRASRYVASASWQFAGFRLITVGPRSSGSFGSTRCVPSSDGGRMPQARHQQACGGRRRRRLSGLVIPSLGAIAFPSSLPDRYSWARR